ncbi:hypothetical protein [Spiroplasma citri]|nr:hypothetical protein [Spiroplasma citri]
MLSFICGAENVVSKEKYFANSDELGKHLKDIGSIIDIPYNV